MALDTTEKWKFLGIDAGKLLRLWVSDLAETIPPSLKSAFQREPSRVIVNCDGGQCSFNFAKAGSSSEFARLEIGALAQQPAELLAQQVAGFAAKSSGDLLVEIQLDDAAVLRHELELPAQAEGNLRQTVSYQLSRLTPFSQEQVYYDVLLTGRDPANRKIHAELIVLPKARTDAIVRDVCRITGHEVSRLTTRGLGERANLLATSRGRFRPNRNFWLLVVLCLCVGLVVASPLLKKRAVVIEQKRQIAELQQSVGDVLRKKNAIEADLRAFEYVAKRRQELPPVTQVLEELSRLVPDGIYLTQLVSRSGQLTLRGQGVDVVGLIDLLNGSPLFDDARFASPVSRNSRTGLDQFSVSARLVGAQRQE